MQIFPRDRSVTYNTCSARSTDLLEQSTEISKFYPLLQQCQQLTCSYHLVCRWGWDYGMDLTTSLEGFMLHFALSDLLPLLTLNGILKEIPSRIQYILRLSVFRSHFHFVIAMCKYWILLFPLWFLWLLLIIQRQIEKSTLLPEFVLFFKPVALKSIPQRIPDYNNNGDNENK